MMNRLRVIQWTTGKVGKMALRGVLDDARLELVGVYAHSPDKVGLDAGAICGRPDCGVAATADVDALITCRADVVVYAPFLADLDHLERLLASGSNVVSTSLLSNLGGMVGEVRERIEAACAQGGASLFITGINPGWLDTLATAATQICNRLSTISVTESVSVAHYVSAETWLAVGFSQASASPEVLASAQGALLSFRDSVLNLATALKLELDDVIFRADYATAAETVDLGWFRMERGTHAALRGGWDGMIAGEAVIRYRVIWYMTRALNEDWAIDPSNYLVDIEGEPGIELRVKVTPPAHWSNLEHAYATAMPAVNAIPFVVAAKPGVLGVQGVGLPAAPAGLWRGLHR